MSAPVHPPDFYRRRPETRKVIVFVHGISGNGVTSWTNGNGTFWPALLTTDPAFDEFDVYLYAYAGALIGACARIPDLAKELETRLAADAAQYKEILFLAHGEGGLIVRRALLGANTDLPYKTGALVFYGTPSGGSTLPERESPKSDCFDDLRQLDINSFLLQQVYDWQRSPLGGRMPTFCATEGSAKVVGTASASLLCTESAALQWPHTDLTRPACLNDYRHLFFRHAVVGLLKTSEAPAVSSSMDRSLEEFARQFRAVELERDILAFWTDVEVGGSTEARRLVDLARSAPDRRIAVLSAALERPELARKFSGRANRVIRAVVGLEPAMLNSIHTVIRTAAFEAEGRTELERAIQSAAMILGIDDPIPPKPTRVPGRDPMVEYFLRDLKAPPEVIEVMRRFYQSRQDARETALTEIKKQAARLSSPQKKELAASFVETFLGADHLIFRTDKDEGCILADALGARAALADTIVRLYLSGELPGNRDDLTSARCLDMNQLSRVGEAAFEKMFIAKQPQPNPTEFGALLAAVRFLPPPAAEAIVHRLAGLALDAGGDWQRRNTVRSLLQAYATRNDVVLSRVIWQKLIEGDHDCADPKDIAHVVAKVEPKDAGALWQQVVACRYRNSRRDWSVIIDAAFALRRHIPRGEHAQMFHEVVDGVQGTWTNSLAKPQLEKLQILANERSDNDIYDVRHYFLHFIRDIGVVGRDVTRELAKTLAERVPRLVEGERLLLDKIARTPSTSIMSREQIADARAFFEAFDARDRGQAVEAFLARGDTTPPLLPEALEAAAFNILRGGVSVVDTAAQVVLAETPVTKRLDDAVVRLVKEHEEMSAGEEELRVDLLQALTGQLRDRARKEADDRAKSSSTPAAFRFANALRCVEARSRRNPSWNRAYETVMSSSNPRHVYSAAGELTDCPGAMLKIEEVERARQVFGARIAEASNMEALALLVAAHRKLMPGNSPEADRVWGRMVDLLLADSSAANMETAARTLALCDPPSKESARRMFSLPFLSDAVVRVVLHHASATARTPLSDWWSAIRWLTHEKN